MSVWQLMYHKMLYLSNKRWILSNWCQLSHFMPRIFVCREINNQIKMKKRKERRKEARKEERKESQIISTSLGKL